MSTKKIVSGKLPNKPHCPNCNKPLDGFSYVRRRGDGEDISPKPGDGTFCVYCYKALIFTNKLDLRQATPAEEFQMRVDSPEVANFVDDLGKA